MFRFQSYLSEFSSAFAYLIRTSFGFLIWGCTFWLNASSMMAFKYHPLNTMGGDGRIQFISNLLRNFLYKNFSLNDSMCFWRKLFKIKNFYFYRSIFMHEIARCCRCMTIGWIWNLANFKFCGYKGNLFALLQYSLIDPWYRNIAVYYFE